MESLLRVRRSVMALAALKAGGKIPENRVVETKLKAAIGDQLNILVGKNGVDKAGKVTHVSQPLTFNP